MVSGGYWILDILYSAFFSHSSELTTHNAFELRASHVRASESRSPVVVESRNIEQSAVVMRLKTND